MIEIYLIGAAWTALALFDVNRPHGVEWLPLALFAAFWPLWWLFVIGAAIKRA
jgi:hypothetical protein